MKSKTKDDSSFLTVKEVSKQINLNPSTIYTILHFDRLEYETIGGRIVIRQEKLDEWQKSNIKTNEKDVKEKEVKKS